MVLERYRYSFLGKQHVENFFRYTKFPALTELVIKDCKFEISLIEIISSSSKNLQKLTIHGSSTSSLDLGLARMRRDYFPNLKWIKLYGMAFGLESLDFEDTEAFMIEAGTMDFEERMDIYDIIDIDE